MSQIQKQLQIAQTKGVPLLSKISLDHFRARWRHKAEALIRHLHVFLLVDKAVFGNCAVYLFDGDPGNLVSRSNLEQDLVDPVRHCFRYASQYHVALTQGSHIWGGG